MNQIRTTETIHQRSSPTSITPPSPARVHPILRLQQSIGNQAVRHLLQSRTIQAKLAISQPGDIYEQEAGRVAEHVMRMPEPAIQRACAPCAAGGAPCPKCEAEKKYLVQRKTEGVSESSDSVPDDFVKGLGPGQPLDYTTRAFFEPRFGRDFSDVRVHADGQAAQTTRSINAKAFTVGRAIAFGAGHYAPDSREGRELLAHELAHVVQQNRGLVSRRIQRAPLVTSGQYGMSLAEFMDQFMREEDQQKKLAGLLKSSKTFVSMARFLDGKIVNDSDPDFTKYDFDKNGWLVTAIGKRPLNKRMLGFAISHEGTYFSPYGKNVPWLGDLIYVEFGQPWLGTEEQIAALADSIAHETAHAVRQIQDTSSAPRNAGDAIKRGVEEEASVRKTAAAVMQEIRKAGRLPTEKAPTTPAEKIRAIESGVAIADVERSFVSVKPTKTYLEMFLLDYMKENLKGDMTHEQVGELKEKVDKFPLDKELLDASYTLKDYGEALALIVMFGHDLPVKRLDYATVYLIERLIGLRWDRFMADVRDGRIAATDYFDRKEAILGQHLLIVEAGKKVAYSSRIKHPL